MLAFAPFSAFADGQFELGAILFLVFLGPFFAYVIVWRYRKTAAGKAFIEALRSIWRGVVTLGIWAGLAAVVIFGVYAAYQNWYPHNAETLVYTNGNWMQGEKRNCVLATNMKPYHLDCTVKTTDDEPHQFDVAYTGADPEDQEKDKPQSWVCTRGASVIRCNSATK
jgi:hypothetical protein